VKILSAFLIITLSPIICYGNDDLKMKESFKNFSKYVFIPKYWVKEYNDISYFVKWGLRSPTAREAELLEMKSKSKEGDVVNKWQRDIQIEGGYLFESRYEKHREYLEGLAAQVSKIINLKIEVVKWSPFPSVVIDDYAYASLQMRPHDIARDPGYSVPLDWEDIYKSSLSRKIQSSKLNQEWLEVKEKYTSFISHGTLFQSLYRGYHISDENNVIIMAHCGTIFRIQLALAKIKLKNCLLNSLGLSGIPEKERRHQIGIISQEHEWVREQKDVLYRMGDDSGISYSKLYEESNRRLEEKLSLNLTRKEKMYLSVLYSTKIKAGMKEQELEKIWSMQ